jgi:hypothetical protein
MTHSITIKNTTLNITTQDAEYNYAEGHIIVVMLSVTMLRLHFFVILRVVAPSLLISKETAFIVTVVSFL